MSEEWRGESGLVTWLGRRESHVCVHIIQDLNLDEMIVYESECDDEILV